MNQLPSIKRIRQRSSQRLFFLIIGLYIAYSLSPLIQRYVKLSSQPIYELNGTFTSVESDLFNVGDKKIRLIGASLPSEFSNCVDETTNRNFRCYARARKLMQSYLGSDIVNCKVIFEEERSKLPLANCYIGDENLAANLIVEGIAYTESHFTGGMYFPEEYWARINSNGLWINYQTHPDEAPKPPPLGTR